MTFADQRSSNEHGSSLSQSDVLLTILMPCLNEAETINSCIRKAQGFLSRTGISGKSWLPTMAASTGRSRLQRVSAPELFMFRSAATAPLCLPALPLLEGNSRSWAMPTTVMISLSLTGFSTRYARARTWRSAIAFVAASCLALCHFSIVTWEIQFSAWLAGRSFTPQFPIFIAACADFEPKRLGDSTCNPAGWNSRAR